MKALACIRQFVSQRMALQLYKRVILPHVDYGDVLHDSLSKTVAKKLQVILNKCLRICLNAVPRSSVEELHNRASIPYLEARRKLHTCKFVYDGVKGMPSDNVNKMFRQINDAHEINTRTHSTCTIFLLYSDHGFMMVISIDPWHGICWLTWQSVRFAIRYCVADRVDQPWYHIHWPAHYVPPSECSSSETFGESWIDLHGNLSGSSLHGTPMAQQ